MTNFYETVYILRADTTEEAVGQAIAKYETILRDQGAEDINTKNLGKRRLAQPIKKQKDGIYVELTYKGQGKEVAPLERAIRLSEDVIRYMTLKQEVSKQAAEPAEAAS